MSIKRLSIKSSPNPIPTGDSPSKDGAIRDNFNTLWRSILDMGNELDALSSKTEGLAIQVNKIVLPGISHIVSSAPSVIADIYVKRDGTKALTGDWDIGAGRMVQGEKIRARSSLGLTLFEAGGKGITVADSTGAVMMDDALTVGDCVTAKSLVGNGTQTVDVLISELQVNGGLDADTDWTKYGNATISGGKGHCLVYGNDQLYGKPFDTIVGAQYTVACVSSNTGTDGLIHAINDENDDGYLNNLSAGSHTFDFVASKTSTWIALTGTDVDWDDIAVKESGKNVFPTHFAIEITNATSIETPIIRLLSGVLPINSLIIISQITGCLGLGIITGDDLYTLDGTYYESMAFVKNSVGWRPISYKSA
jgi:hypothetical protein